MKKFITSSLAALFIFTLLSPSFLSAEESSPFEGVWINIDPEASSPPRIEIEIQKEGTASFIWWGKTHSENSKYGPFELVLYGNSPRDPHPAAYGTVVYVNHFSERLFTLEMDGGYLKVSMFTQFKDDSGRSPYCVKMSFKRE